MMWRETSRRGHRRGKRRIIFSFLGVISAFMKCWLNMTQLGFMCLLKGQLHSVCVWSGLDNTDRWVIISVGHFWFCSVKDRAQWCHWEPYVCRFSLQPIRLFSLITPCLVAKVVCWYYNQLLYALIWMEICFMHSSRLHMLQHTGIKCYFPVFHPTAMQKIKSLCVLVPTTLLALETSWQWWQLLGTPTLNRSYSKNFDFDRGN